MVKAILFDMDGVLIHSVPLHRKAWDIIFKKYNIMFTSADFDLINGTTVMDGLQILKYKYNLDIDVESIAKEKNNLVIEYYHNELEVDPYVDELLKSLKPVYKLALASSSPKKLIEVLLKRLKENYFDYVISGESLKHSKPNPEIFLRCAENLNEIPEDCVVIEDAKAGIKAAKSAKMKCIAIKGSHDIKLLSQADLILDSIHDLSKDVIERQ